MMLSALNCLIPGLLQSQMENDQRKIISRELHTCTNNGVVADEKLNPLPMCCSTSYFAM